MIRNDILALEKLVEAFLLVENDTMHFMISELIITILYYMPSHSDLNDEEKAKVSEFTSNLKKNSV